jgi:cytochrome c oxidase subunit 2
MFKGASNFAGSVDSVFLYITIISLVFLIGLTFAMVWFTIRYSRKRHPKPVQIKDNMKLEVAWTVIPLILVLSMFYYGYTVFVPMRNIPDDAMLVKATGRMWDWTFEYPNGKKTRELVLPVDKPVKFDLTSVDVIHSFYIPAFRVKEDMVPGKITSMWFIPTIKDTFDVFCAEYCGQRHSFMTTYAIIISDEDFEQWLAQTDADSDDHPGLIIMRNNACLSCHSLDGSKLVGPSFKGLYNSPKKVIIAGKETQLIANDEYITRAIYDPDAELVKGYDPKLMRSYKEVIGPDDMLQIIDYFKNHAPQ